MAIHRTRFFLLLAAAVLAASPRAAATEEDGGAFLDIPGLGRIPLPPALGRRLAPEAPPRREETRRSESAARTPREKLTPAQARAKIVEELAARLRRAADPAEAEAIGALLRSAFADAPSETAGLIATRAAKAQKEGAPSLALTLLDRLIAIDPAWSEAFMQRAQLRLSEGDFDGARADFDNALRLEPRRFDALASLGALREEGGDKKGALEAYRGALALSPKSEILRRAEQRLRIEVEGRDI